MVPNRPTPFRKIPDAHQQLRAFLKARPPLALLTTGAANPTIHTPTHSMVALTTLLAQSRREHNWSVLPWGDNAHENYAFFQHHACQGWKRQAAVLPLHGANSPVIGWLFADKSLILSIVHHNTLRLYPAVLWLRSRELSWTPSVLMGSKKTGPYLRVNHISHKRTTTHQEHITPALGMRRLDEQTYPIGAQIQSELDTLVDAFSCLQGTAVWPDGDPLPDNNCWPTWMPARPHSASAQNAHQHTIDALAEWCAAFVRLQGIPDTTLTLEKYQNHLIIWWGDRGSGTQHNTRLLSIEDIDHLFPPALAQQAHALITMEDGLAYVPAKSGIRAHTFQPWYNHTCTQPIPTSTHAVLRTIARHGQAPTTAAQHWATLK